MNQWMLFSLIFAKGFDKLDIGLLLQRLEEIGIQGKVQSWFSAFLKGRQQKVKVNGTLSRASEVRSGVPQGTILGPLLFILYIAPLAKLHLNCSIISYADDYYYSCLHYLSRPLLDI